MLQATDRLAEAEPLMGRVLEIFRAFERTTGYQHPNLNRAFDNYSRRLTAMGRSEAEIAATLATLAGPPK